MYKIDKEKYYQILRTDGLSAAITALHQDKNQYEYETFEGNEGYQREMWNYLQEICDFSRELWNTALNETPSAAAHSSR